MDNLDRKVNVDFNDVDLTSLDKLEGVDSLISYKETDQRLVFHIRFHLADGIVFNFTNNKVINECGNTTTIPTANIVGMKTLRTKI